MAFRVVIRSLAVLFSSLLAACGGTGGSQGRAPSGPNWSLTDKKPQGLGAVTQSAPAQVPSASPYEYRGGRDAITGQARTVEGASAPAPVGAPTKRPPPSGQAAAATAARRTVEVQKGDTLHGLSLQHHVSVNALMAANGLASAKIVPGQKLVLPPEL
jgi:nucleoid-associated protein YgaU